MRRLKAVHIQDVKGVQCLDFEAGAVTVLSGRNAAGKSSAIDAIVSVFEGGHDPGLIRNGAEFGLVELKLEDGVTISKKITQKDSYLRIKTQDGGKISAEATYVKKLATGFKFNPAAFITMTGKERATELTKVMPIIFTGAEVNEAVGEPGLIASSDVVSLDRFAQIRAGRYEKRTDVKREWDTAAGFVQQAESSLPKGDQDSWSGVVEVLRSQVSDARAELERSKADVADRKSAASLELKNACRLEIEQIEREAAERVAAMRRDLEIKLSLSGSAFDQELATLNTDSSASLAEMTTELGKAEASLADQQRVEGMRKQIEQMKSKCGELGRTHGHLERAIAGLDKLKNTKLASLPIPGVEVRSGDKGPEVYVGGIAWDHVNKSTQCRVAISIAAQALGDLPLMVLDEAEVLDSNTMETLIDAAKGVGLQVIMARVADEQELTVTAR